MTKTFDTIRVVRNNFLKVIDDLTLEEINRIPEGFNNNIAWNVGHIIVSQQILCYQFSSLKPVIDERYMLAYKAGTKPADALSQTEVDDLKFLLTVTINRLEEDLSNEVFKDYTTLKTRFGVELNSIQEAIAYIPVHESLHLGSIMALKRVIRK